MNEVEINKEWKMANDSLHKVVGQLGYNYLPWKT